MLFRGHDRAGGRDLPGLERAHHPPRCRARAAVVARVVGLSIRMRLEPKQLAHFVRLTDEWIDAPLDARARWLSARRRDHPGLAQALSAMNVESSHDGSTGADPLSLPRLGGIAFSDADEPCPGDLVGPYRLLSRLGHGGMCSVWLAEQVGGRLSRRLALKLPLPGLAQGD